MTAVSTRPRVRACITSTLAALLLVCTSLAAAQELTQCDPLDPYRCYLPFPNDFWRRPDATTKKLHLNFTSETFPVSNLGHAIDPVQGGWNDLDGWSPIMPISTYFANLSLELSDIPRVWNISHSLDVDSPTVLLDTVTGERLPHFAELDHRSDVYFPDGYPRVLMIWPTEALTNGRRYIVALRNLQDTSGASIPPSTAFKAFRDNIPTHDPDVELRRAHFKDIFQSLELVSVSQASLTLAWDFTVASENNTIGRMVHIRDDAATRVPSGGPKYTIDSVEDNYSDNIFRRVTGTMQVPLYLKHWLPNNSFVLGPDGLPVFQGYAPANFTVLIPRSLVESGQTGDVLQYGHGLFGSQREVQDGYLQNISTTAGYVLLATDWWGLDENDAIYVGVMLVTDITDFKIVPDRCSQGMLNALLAMQLTLGDLSKDPALNPNGKAVIDSTSSAYYYGNSQGGILGSVYTSLSQQVTRATLGVPGGPYALLLPRSKDFTPFYKNMHSVYTDPVDLISVLGILQGLWSRLDPGGYMAHITSNPPVNTQPHQILIQYGVGDAQVSYLGAYSIARSAGAKMFESNVKMANQTTFGFEYIPDNAIGHTAMLVGWEFPNTPPVPQENVPPNPTTDTHDLPRKQLDAQHMMMHFFATGEIINTCGGTCHGSR